uniref:Uncharacterized protein n=1 Tax=Avena sativa TaxID=4498 RepID=A0ACD5XQL4_AVESA
MPIEKHATRVYTRAMFECFYRELFRSGEFACIEDVVGGCFTVTYAHVSTDTESVRQNYSVMRNAEKTDYACVCRSFEHTGIPCRHVLKVLVHVGAVELPTGLVEKRWTINAREGAECFIPGYADAVSCGDNAASMHSLLHASAMELVGMGTTSRKAFEVAVEYVSHAKVAISMMTVDDPGRPDVHATSVPIDGSEKQLFDSSVAAPPRVRSRGRPKELRYKSPIESPGACKRSAQ